MPKIVDKGSGVYRRCRDCEVYRPLREFQGSADVGKCRACAPPVTRKLCLSCCHVKPIDDFHVDRTARDGRRAECKDCRNRECRLDWRRKRQQDRAGSSGISRMIMAPWG